MTDEKRVLLEIALYWCEILNYSLYWGFRSYIVKAGWPNKSYCLDFLNETDDLNVVLVL